LSSTANTTNGRRRIDIGVRENSAKDRTYPLELKSGAAGLLFAGVTDHDEMGCAYFQPGNGLRPSKR
jgi:hypothetical protein